MEDGFDIEMLRLGLDEEELKYYSKEKISINKRMARMTAEARQNAKRETCFICGKPCTSFCNSHSVPRFCLKRIATDGKVYMSGVQKVLPLLGEDSGVNSAGTFRLICQECDGTLFQAYENPTAYSEVPSGGILAQIVMKNYLLMISKRLVERELYTLALKGIGEAAGYAKQQLEVIKLDLAEYISEFERAKKAGAGKHDDWYYLCYYKKLDYVVPYAFQGPVVLVGDFEGNIVNDIYNMSPQYHTRDIHIAVFPLKTTSVVMMIVDGREKRYRKFYRQLKKLPMEKQLAAINYIIFGYSENVFISKDIPNAVLESKNFLDTCQKTSIAVSYVPMQGSALQAALSEYNLAKAEEIPNLLSGEYALSL